MAANLAIISIAQGIEEHVLLMDCDMRRSSIHTRFGFNHGGRGPERLPGQQKTAGIPAQENRCRQIDHTAGRHDAAESIGTAVQPGHEGTAQRNQKPVYSDRYIIVDSPPPQLTAETTALANYIDAIILVVKYGSTPKDLIRNLLEKLGREKVIGVVMNGYRVPTTERYGYGKYKKYKKY